MKIVIIIFILFLSIPYIFGVNLDIKFYEGKCGKNFFSNVKNILFTCDKNVLGNLNENLLPKTHVDRVCSEYVNEEYYILQFE